MPRRKNTLEEQLEAKKRDAERKRIRRIAMTEQERTNERERDAESHRNRLANMTEAQRANERERNAQSERNRLANMTEAQRANERERNAESHKNRYANLALLERQFKARLKNLTLLIGSIDKFDESTIVRHTCGLLDNICRYCNAKHFEDERPSDGEFQTCCNKGKVDLRDREIQVSDTIKDLMTNNHEHSKNFMENIRSFNSALAFASMGANIAPPPGYGPYCFRIHGQLYHRAGTLNPVEGEQRKFAQLYILDPEAASEQRMNITGNSKCNANLMQELSTFMTSNNPFAGACKMLHEVEQESIIEAQQHGLPPPVVKMAIVQDRKTDLRRYNTPNVNEVAVVFQNADGEPPLERDLLIHCRVNENDPNAKRMERISVLDPNLDPMVYPLLFPYGEQSWGAEIPLHQRPKALKNLNKPAPAKPRTRVTQMQYYSYRFQVRDEFNPFLNAGKLTQQFFVDSYVKTEANRLNWHKQNQSNLRTEQYTGLRNHINSRAEAEGIMPGTPIILPSTFKGSPRNMALNYQDAMAIVRKYGNPDVFVTMTCNPKWEEISAALESWQSAEHRPDIVARVFKIKLKSLLNDICSKHVLGVTIASVHVIEFQKRGLPHAHILLILKAEHKPKTLEIIDNLVSAEIPDIEIHPDLHAIVTKHMIHGPCGKHNPNSPCMDNGKCTKNFPKEFQEETLANSGGYPKYRRREEPTAIVRGKTIDNRWVVPYNPFLSLRYNCHINVEVCASVKSVKYLFKYVYKGHDCANVTIQETRRDTLEHNEIKQYMDSRYVSAPEAVWRLFEFRMHEQSHVVAKLQVHLPNQQSVSFDPDDIEGALGRSDRKASTLLAWFKLNETDPSAKEFHYIEIPEHYTFLKGTGKYKQRERGGEKTIGRMHSVNFASDAERFSLRLLLLHVRGATSFEDLRTFEGEIFDTFQDCARRRGLLKDEKVWERTLNDATIEKMPRQLRDLFAYICCYAAPKAIELWEKFKSDMCEDFAHHYKHPEGCSHCENLALSEIENILIINGKNCAVFGLPIPNKAPHNPFDDYDPVSELTIAQEMQESLNAEQHTAFITIMDAIDSQTPSCKSFFLDGPGGCGKTHLYKTLLNTIRSTSGVALPTASTGIAANLLKGGRTYHSQFKLRMPLLDGYCMRMTDDAATSIRQAKIIVWDESTMASHGALSTVDRLLKEIMRNDIPFGGKVLLLGGDFRQTLPIVPNAPRAAIVETSIKFNKYWEKFKILKLKTNVRSVDPEFSKFLIKIGDGELLNSDDLPEEYIEIPDDLLSEGGDFKSLIKDIFGEKLTPNNVSQFSKMAILCPKNDDVDMINEQVLNILEGESRTYLSSDSVDDEIVDDPMNYSVEYLNELSPSGMPPHKLNLKVGAIVMLLRNLNTKRGLCNGTRLIVKDMKPNVIIAEVLTGSAEGQIVFIPRIDLAPTDVNLPFVLRRRQFPIKLAFAMTINKSQGQTLEKVGIYLPEPVFGHGQLYVAMSRVRRRCDVKFVIKQGPDQGKLIQGSDKVFTKNVVFKEIFSH